MSHASFPRAEHAALLHAGIAEILRRRAPGIELSERGLDHYRCCYRFGMRRSPEDAWSDLSIHFQVANRLEADPSATELDQQVRLFLERTFGSGGPGGNLAENPEDAEPPR